MAVRDLPPRETRRTTHELVRDVLRGAILSGDLPQGTHLVQAEIASRLQVSTTPVREALRDLIADGLAVSTPHVGTVVRGINLEELTELYELRKALEPLAIRRAAARITADELDAAAAVQRELDACGNDPARFVQLNLVFHSIIDDAARATLLAPIRVKLQEMAALYIGHSARLRPSWIEDRNREHRGILEALAERDGERAVALIVQHLDATLEALTSAAAAAPTLQAAGLGTAPVGQQAV